MDESEAKAILETKIARLRSLGYDGVQGLLGGDARQVHGPSGTLYTIETQAFPDDPRTSSDNLRVIVSIDDGHGLRAFVPLSEDFIIAPDGTFMGETESPPDGPADRSR